ncbi:C2H2-type zinc finger-containing protein [Tieghemostelium lacteum]|uniref:C2H2-type zinc finger-containing protein n=1 Tax=Tieghemostelium lacteum TaxID=361077 RepID=A0A152A100_TIELA|nr:C2H2-type zinc finger-containing protein [Tieghemostelium lacteum]|eukprot:KYQ99796.1 C2H2-type zinc finger-containing protein [Tieghemostelium lacteum]
MEGVQTTATYEGIFTCISCRVQFMTPEEQRDHFKSEYHRFNLKRKAFDLPPVTFEVFEAKVAALKKEETSKETQHTKLECRICDKRFQSEGPYQQHLVSNKHKNNVAAGVPEKIRNPKPPVEQPSIEEQPRTLEEQEKLLEDKIRNAKKYPLEMCLFCSHHSETLEKSVEHMVKVHSFFIPDIEYLIDLPGLIRYLSDKICIGNICLYCNGKGKIFKDKDATQTHMRDLSHCKLNYDTEENEEEYEDYFDFTSQYKDSDQVSQGEDGQLMLNQPDIVYNGHEIVFPDGLTIGHRDYAVYYKQRYTKGNERLSHLRSIISQYRLLGWNETPKTQFQLDKKRQRQALTLDIKVGMKKNTQRYYKNQLLVQ